MSDELKNPVKTGDAAPSNDDSVSPTKELGVNERLLEESKTWKQRAIKAEKASEDAKKAQLVEQGKYKEMYESERQKNENLSKAMIKKEVSTSVAREAQKLGCVDAEALLKLSDMSLLQFDEETGTVHGAELLALEGAKKFPYLFQKTKAPMINPSTPNGVDKEKNITAADIAKLPQGQKMAHWAAALSGKK